MCSSDLGQYVGDESGKDESSSIQNFLLIGKDDNAPASSTYKVILSTIPVPLSVGATNSDHSNGESTGTAVSAEVKLLVFQPSLVKYGTSGIVTTDQEVNNIGDSFSTEIPQGTELVVIAHAEFDDSSNGNQNADNFGLKQDGTIVSQTTKDSTDDYQTFELRSQGGANAPSNFGATLLWRVEYAEQPPVYQLQVNSTTGNGDLKAMSKIISFSTVNEGRLPGVTITNFDGTDPDGTTSGETSGYSNGDILTLTFSEKTNRPPAGSKGEIDELFDFKKDGSTQSIGNDYIGKSFTGIELNIDIHYLSRSHGWSTTKFKKLIADTIKTKK